MTLENLSKNLDALTTCNNLLGVAKVRAQQGKNVASDLENVQERLRKLGDLLRESAHVCS